MDEIPISDELIVRNIIFAEKNRIVLFKKVPFTTIHPVSAWPFILEYINKKTSQEFIYELGRKMGESAAKEIYCAIKQNEKFINSRLASVFSLLPYTGFGKCKIEKTDDKMFFSVRDLLIISESKEKYGDSPTTCSFFSGFFEPFVEREIGQKVSLKKTKCVCKGDEICEWEITFK